MGLYPIVLASFETLGAASLKAVTSMIMVADDSLGKSPALYIVILLWIVCIGSTVVWLRKVYEKFKTTECLPTEIGFTTFLSIFVALMFYEERKLVDSEQQLIILILSACLIIVGIFVMTSNSEVDSGPSNAGDHVRKYPMMVFPARKVWHRSITKVMITNSIAASAAAFSNTKAPDVVVVDLDDETPSPAKISDSADSPTVHGRKSSVSPRKSSFTSVAEKTANALMHGAHLSHGAPLSPSHPHGRRHSGAEDIIS